ncbi:hypothetical protein GGP41_003324 [Bipolaris sorokiniana]|uniref:Uncharacterized protein n=1 Tax=Cochliobolus sativus TaxID=45130 RepID=A0A8H6DSR3_COCSA|nr:hypothetical protein GGP41_003324 [Bipolaris sorokiniana]
MAQASRGEARTGLLRAGRWALGHRAGSWSAAEFAAEGGREVEITEYILSTSRAGQPTMQRRAGMAAAVCMYGYGFGMRHRHTRRSVVVAHTHSAEWTGVAEEGVELINETRRDPLSAFLFAHACFTHMARLAGVGRGYAVLSRV